MEPLKYFVFNKERDYRRGYLDRVNVTDQGLELQIEQKKESRPIPIWQHGTFISRLLDSGELLARLWRQLAEGRGLDPEAPAADPAARREEQYRRLGEAMRKSLDMAKIYEILEAGV